jgi:hypothetical protein
MTFFTNGNFHKIFSAERLLQIITVLGATVVMKLLS